MIRYLILGFLVVTLTSQAQETVTSPVKKVFFKSLLCPAWGMKSLQQKSRSTIYLLNDLALLSGYVGFFTRGNWKKQEYHVYAVEHAGIINPNDKPTTFYRDLKFYQSVYEHNLYAGTDVYRDTYTYYWEWESDEHKLHYKQIRNSSETAYQTAQFFIGGILLNHIIGAIDAVRISRRQTGESSPASSYVYISPGFDPHSIQLLLTYSF